MVLVRTRRRQRLVIKHRRFVSTDNNSCCDGGGRRGPEKVIIPVRIPPNLFVSKKNRRLCRRPRFAPYPKSSRSKTMFKQGYSSDGMINNQASTSIPPPPPATALNMQFNGQPSFSAFTPDYYQQFPYTFSSATPPMYSWANTNSTDIMKFTGSSNPLPLDTSTYHPNNFGSVPKRKIDLDAELPQPPKMRITEEKVSASLRDMHISSEFKSHSCLKNDVSQMDIVVNPSIINTSKTTKPTQTTLVMCEELRKLNKIDSIIPQPLLNVERPTNAIVVWRPQPIMNLVHSFSNNENHESTVVITEITEDEENDMLIEMPTEDTFVSVENYDMMDDMDDMEL